ncbi:11608_t:CDS:2 [Scutellospora calospora]|uniref:11608_t:CDS:1 n=1 Tax=Scutellospora calospora TaxID=85575 RepID=A0ACA9K7J2_9GLOM|nr:11608_t:CDS:2 [Scutellospora calospora]
MIENKVITKQMQLELESETVVYEMFLSLSQADIEELFERISQNIVVKIDLSNFIKKYLQDLLDKDIKSVFLKVRNLPSKDTKPLLL